MGYDSESLGYEVVNKNGRDDVDNHKMHSLAVSAGWCPLPKSKLPYWDPDDDKQWKVSYWYSILLQ